jgi:hypothetical protein
LLTGASKPVQNYVPRIKEKFRLKNMNQVMQFAVMAYRTETGRDLGELLHCAEKIEVRFFDTDEVS